MRHEITQVFFKHQKIFKGVYDFTIHATFHCLHFRLPDLATYAKRHTILELFSYLKTVNYRFKYRNRIKADKSDKKQSRKIDIAVCKCEILKK